MGSADREVPIKLQLERFLRSDRRSTILRSPEILVVVRRDERSDEIKEGETVLTVVRADATTKGQGSFTRFLNMAETACLLPVCVERVTEPRLEGFLERRGYRRIIDSNPPSFLRRRPRPSA